MVEITFKEDCNPNEGALPEYVIVDFPNYRGPPWDLENKSHVPIPMSSVPCKYKCCTRRFCPLDLCFARTLHTFQGLSTGPPNNGKDEHMYHAAIIDPGEKEVEGSNTGLFYTGLSRGSTLGDSNGLHSAIYFIGNHLTKERIQTLTLRKNSIQEYLNVTKRRHWVLFLENHTIENQNPNTRRCKACYKFFFEPLSYETIYNQISKYVS